MNKKYISIALGVATGMAVLTPAFAQNQNDTTNTSQKMMRSYGQQENERGRENKGRGYDDNRQMMNRPVAAGTVTSIVNNIITISGHLGMASSSATQTTFTIDATNANIFKNNATTTISSILVGNTIAVEGKLTGTNIVATTIREGILANRSRGGTMGNNNRPLVGQQLEGNGQPVIAGTISAINGTLLTITNKSNVIYTAETAAAKIIAKNATTTLANVKVGDSVVIQGAINGTTIVASTVIDNGMPKVEVPSQLMYQNNPVRGFLSNVGGFFSRMFGF